MDILDCKGTQSGFWIWNTKKRSIKTLHDQTTFLKQFEILITTRIYQKYVKVLTNDQYQWILTSDHSTYFYEYEQHNLSFVYFFSAFFPCCRPTDIDECVSGVHDCHSSASCTNTVGSYTCSCNHPLSGDRKTCRYTAAGENFTFIMLLKCK